MTSGSFWIDQNTTVVIFGAYGGQTISDAYERCWTRQTATPLYFTLSDEIEEA